MKSIALLSLALLGGCAIGPDRATVLNALVGQPETEAIRRLGVPARTYDAGGHKFLAFTEQRTQIVGGGPFLFGGGFYGSQYGYFGGFPGDVVQRECETTLDVTGGRVAGWSLRGNACG